MFTVQEPVLVLGDPKGALHVLNDASKYHRPDIDKQVLDMWVRIRSRLSSLADVVAHERNQFGRSLLSSEGEHGFVDSHTNLD